VRLMDWLREHLPGRHPEPGSVEAQREAELRRAAELRQRAAQVEVNNASLRRALEVQGFPVPRRPEG
jgi:hypothetical protein